MHDFVQYVESYLGSNQTPGGAGNIFWATVYVLWCSSACQSP